MSRSVRRAVTALIFLVAGVIVSVVVAWVLPIALTPSPTKPPHATMAWGPAQDRKSEWWMVSVYNTFATDSQRWNWYGTQAEATKWSDWYINWGHTQAAQDPKWGVGVTLSEFSLSTWSAIHHNDLERFDPALIPAGALTPPDRCYTFWEMAQGWPLRCVRGTQLTADGAMAILPITDIGLYFRDPQRPMPYIPIPLGLLADTLIYAGVLASPFFLFARIKAVRRRRRGLCARCGYDRKGLADGTPCPECGG